MFRITVTMSDGDDFEHLCESIEHMTRPDVAAICIRDSKGRTYWYPWHRVAFTVIEPVEDLQLTLGATS